MDEQCIDRSRAGVFLGSDARADTVSSASSGSAEVHCAIARLLGCHPQVECEKSCGVDGDRFWLMLAYGPAHNCRMGRSDLRRKVKDMYLGSDLCAQTVILDPAITLHTPEPAPD